MHRRPQSSGDAQQVAAHVGSICVQEVSPSGEGRRGAVLRQSFVHSFHSLYPTPTLCRSRRCGPGARGASPRLSPGGGLGEDLVGCRSHPSLFLPLSFPHPSSPSPPRQGGGLTPAPSWTAAPQGRCGGGRAGRARVCSGCGAPGPRPRGIRRLGAARRARRPRARVPCTRGPVARPPASPSRALRSTVFATMFSSSMGCGAAGPPGAATPAGIARWSRGRRANGAAGLESQ